MAPTQVSHDIDPRPLPTQQAAGNSSTQAHSSKGMGLLIAIISCFAFGMSGPLGKSLISAGWTPVTAVAARITIGAAVLAVPAAMALRGRWNLLAENWKPIVLYGIFGVAGCQLAYFNAVTHMSVGVSLLIEYLAPVLLVGYAWARYGRTPRPLTIAGVVAAVVGLLCVLNVFEGFSVSPIGLAWASGAAICLVIYFIIAGDDESSLPPIALGGGGMIVGAALLLAMCAFGVQPVSVSSASVTLAHASMQFWVPVLGLGLIAAAVAYATGIYAARVLGATVASFISLGEVLVAILASWVLLSEQPTWAQAIGGVFILAGVILVRADEARHSESFGPVVAAEHDAEVTSWLEGAQDNLDADTGARHASSGCH